MSRNLGGLWAVGGKSGLLSPPECQSFYVRRTPQLACSHCARSELLSSRNHFSPYARGRLLSSRVILVSRANSSARPSVSPSMRGGLLSSRVVIMCRANFSARVTISVLALCALLSSPECQPFCERRTPQLARECQSCVKRTPTKLARELCSKKSKTRSTHVLSTDLGGLGLGIH
ncbi:hypothetical protein ACLB2K_072988 [Fragaria x ananassa]